METRVREQREHVQELRDAARPSVRQDEREGLGTWRAGVQEMDAQAVDRGRELRDGVEPPLRRPPDVVLRPARTAMLEALERHALARVGGRLGPARRAQPSAQVLQLGVGDAQREPLDHRRDADWRAAGPSRAMAPVETVGGNGVWSCRSRRCPWWSAPSGSACERFRG